MTHSGRPGDGPHAAAPRLPLPEQEKIGPVHSRLPAVMGGHFLRYILAKVTIKSFLHAGDRGTKFLLDADAWLDGRGVAGRFTLLLRTYGQKGP